MADKTQAPRAVELTWGQQYHAIVEAEIGAINTRRESRQVGKPEPDKMIDVVGLSLSGGGIRSAAICLGVLQALNHHGLLSRIDYLSTVSGGGYIGSSFTATMTRAKEFVFGKAPDPGSLPERASEISDTPAVGHIRNYSNYLIPAGARDLVTGIAIVVRGLVANISLTLPVLLLLAAVTTWSTPLRSCLYVANLFGLDVGEERPKQCVSPHLGLIDEYGFISAGALLALLLLLGSGIARLGSRSVGGKAPSIFLAYLAVLALTIGFICAFARLLPVHHFALTLAAFMIGIVLYFAWALLRSFLPPDRLQEFRGHLPTMGAIYLILVPVIALFELQPFMIGAIFAADDGVVAGTDSVLSAIGSAITSGIKYLAAITAPIAAVVTMFRQQFAEALKGNSASSEIGSRVIAVAAKLAIWLAGAALPLLLWVGYLHLSFWGVGNDRIFHCPPSQTVCKAESIPNTTAGSTGLTGKIQFDSKASTFSAVITPEAAPAAPSGEPTTLTSHAPGWLVSLIKPFGDPTGWDQLERAYTFGRSAAALYAVAALLLFFLSLFLKPNANSLHRLYRDRLSKAFLFDPKPPADGKPARNEPSMDQGRDFPDLDNMKLSALYPQASGSDQYKLEAPYHLINCALNIQGSDYANRRGRNADFFLFSPLRVGSEATGYATTRDAERAAPGLDLATAMAISGAAVSSNMGSSSIKPLTPTLALLNVRLGFWLKNPLYYLPAGKKNGQPEKKRGVRRHDPTALYLWSEISGRLYENSDAVYLTDGGHIENLGVYELLRRRCKVIIAVDAEADAPMNFSALMTLQRYARIDLGIRIDLPWTPIRTRTLALMSGNAGKPPSPAASSSPPPAAEPVKPNGPHTAIGIIDYGGGEKGYLLYIKSSLSGDENDYIRDYARRNASFPHETTGDQFFSEEQFEVYRALGFHMTHEFLSGDDQVVAAVDGNTPLTTKFNVAGAASIDAVRAALGFPALVDPPGNPASGASELS
jgi:predicted acylesterase/phospholipase RssA